MEKYILALDQGTSSSRAVLFDSKGKIKGLEQREFRQIYPHSGWVEHDPLEILSTQLEVMHNVVSKNKIKPDSIVAIGITNQRETTVIWNRKTGQPVYNAIVWQDKRTIGICEKLKSMGLGAHINKTTGLLIDSYFSATKIRWILDNVSGTQSMAEKGELAFGTIDSWLLWNLTEKKIHATDYSNASRTMLFDINKLRWDNKLLKALEIPISMMPSAQPSAYSFGESNILGHKIPITAMAGDQQAALFGQACFEQGMVKNTYGTGCFMLLNIGSKIKYSKKGLLTTIAWGLDGKVEYAMEGSVFIAGAAVQWLRDGLKIIDKSEDSEYFASKVKDYSGVYVVPAFAGLGAPYWDMYARGAIFGLTRDTGKEHIIKATLESMAYQTSDVLTAMQEDTGIKISSLNVDGGASSNNLLMQFQSDILNITIERPEVVESTAIGAAYLAGIEIGLWTKKDILKFRKIQKRFEPKMNELLRKKLIKGWKKSIERTKSWIDNNE